MFTKNIQRPSSQTLRRVSGLYSPTPIILMATWHNSPIHTGRCGEDGHGRSATSQGVTSPLHCRLSWIHMSQWNLYHAGAVAGFGDQVPRQVTGDMWPSWETTHVGLSLWNLGCLLPWWNLTYLAWHKMSRWHFDKSASYPAKQNISLLEILSLLGETVRPDRLSSNSASTLTVHGIGHIAVPYLYCKLCSPFCKKQEWYSYLPKDSMRSHMQILHQGSNLESESMIL